MFQSTRPYGARHCEAASAKYGRCMFQSTRPYGARRVAWHAEPTCIEVSIHAPVRGATVCLRSACIRRSMFQSTRPYGARPCMPASRVLVEACFNPRARTGRDHLWPGVTPGDTRFNPRARTGRDALGLRSSSTIAFQSTRPYGARQSRSAARQCMACFNPRARTGRDAAYRESQ